MKSTSMATTARSDFQKFWSYRVATLDKKVKEHFDIFRNANAVISVNTAV